MIRVPVEEVHDHFLTYSWDGDLSKTISGPALSDSYPAGALFVVLPFSVPVELDFDPAVFVGIDLFTFRTGDDGGLYAVDAGLG